MKKCRVGEEGRECCVCGVYKVWEEYNKNIRGVGGYDGRCRECTRKWRDSDEYRGAGRERARRDYADPEKKAKQQERMRGYYSRPDVVDRMGSEEWRFRCRERQRKWRAEMGPEERERMRRRNRERQMKYMEDPVKRLSSRMSSSIRIRLKAKGLLKGGRHWEDLVGYTVDELKVRLEGLWEKGMSWENYGEWHVDHVIPVAAHGFKGVKDVGFRKCWGLENLAPRWATTETARRYGSESEGNIEKGAKMPDLVVCSEK